MHNISLIIPAYNEEQRLGQFLTDIRTFTNANPAMLTEIIVVDDGSTDQTIDVVNSHRDNFSKFQILKHQTNQGKGAAVKTGVMAAQGDLIVFMDADGATPITELPKMISALQSNDIGIGNRWMAGAKTERHSPLRQFSSRIYRTYMTFFGLGAIDTMCGFKGYRHDIAKKLFANLQEKRWLFDTEIAYKSVQASYTIKNFPISWESKDGSKLDTKTLIKTAFEIYPLIKRIKHESAKGQPDGETQASS